MRGEDEDSRRAALVAAALRGDLLLAAGAPAHEAAVLAALPADAHGTPLLLALAQRGAATAALLRALLLLPLPLGHVRVGGDGVRPLRPEAVASLAVLLDADGATALHAAARSLYLPTAALLLRAAAAPGQPHLMLLRAAGREQQTPLHVAAACGNTAFFAAAFHALGGAATVELLAARDAQGRTPLFTAAAGGHCIAVAFLLRHETQGPTRDVRGRTLPHVAADRCDARLLTCVEASPFFVVCLSAADSDGQRPLELAAAASFDDGRPPVSLAPLLRLVWSAAVSPRKSAALAMWLRLRRLDALARLQPGSRAGVDLADCSLEAPPTAFDSIGGILAPPVMVTRGLAVLAHPHEAVAAGLTSAALCLFATDGRGDSAGLLSLTLIWPATLAWCWRGCVACILPALWGTRQQQQPLQMRQQGAFEALLVGALTATAAIALVAFLLTRRLQRRDILGGACDSFAAQRRRAFVAGLSFEGGEGVGADEPARLCVTCELARPPRAVHCERCGACVAGFDHHCSWTGCCISESNHGVFIVFVGAATAAALLWITLLSCYVALCAPVAAGSSSGVLAHLRHAPLWLLVSLQPLWMAAYGLVLLAGQARLIAASLTTNESRKWRRPGYAYLRRSGGGFRNPFAAGSVRANCRRFWLRALVACRDEARASATLSRARLAALACAAACAAAQSLHHVADEFTLVAASPLSAVLRFSAALPMSNAAELEAAVLDISNPASPRYGAWMTQKQVAALTAPLASVRAEVRAWVTSTGAVCGDMPTSLRCTATVAQVNELLNTTVSAFRQAGKAALVHRLHPDTPYTFPAHLDGKLLFLTNLADFPTVRRRNGQIQAIDVIDGKAAATDYAVLLETLAAFYQTAGVMGSAAATTSPAEFQEDSCWSEKDLKAMAKANGVKNWTVTVKAGPCTGKEPDAEASLDEQYMGAVGLNNTQWYWTDADWMYDWTQTLMATPDANLSQVFSISWGWSESDQCTIDKVGPCVDGKNSSGFVLATNLQFAAVTARGVTFMVSSGDSGAHGRTDDSCMTNKTHPDWPTSCPWITAVGATQIENGTSTGPFTSPYCIKPPDGLPKCADGGVEITCSTATKALITSGGGFSQYEPTPAWQQSQVTAYLASGAKLPGPEFFNATGRGYPDVSANGHNYIIWVGGQPMQVDGTSCSAPVWGAITGLVNAARLALGKKVVGFANPALYSLPASVWHDTVVGDNSCTEGGCFKGKCTGFGATAGWDAATGFGSPSVQALVAAWSAL